MHEIKKKVHSTIWNYHKVPPTEDTAHQKLSLGLPCTNIPPFLNKITSLNNTVDLYGYL